MVDLDRIKQDQRTNRVVHLTEESHAHSGGSVASYEVVKNNFAQLMSLQELEDKIQP